MPWNYKRYGTALDPIHKSHLNALTGDYGCPAQFKFDMDEAANGVDRENTAREVSGKAACGTAGHETIARALTNAALAPRLIAGDLKSDLSVNVRKVFEDELDREVSGREVNWYKDDAKKLIYTRSAMVHGLLRDIHKHVSKVELVEPAFIVKLGPYWLCGHVDLVYRPREDPAKLGLADWKTGKQKPGQLDLDHGWEAGVYSTAVHQGVFLPRESLEMTRDPATGWWTAETRGWGIRATHPSRYLAERRVLERTLIMYASQLEDAERLGFSGVSCALERYPLEHFGVFPDEIYHVHLGDYVPYEKSGQKEAKRPEDLKFYELATPATVKYVRGQMRGPAWLPVARTAYDVPRLQARLRKVVGMVRMGCFIDQVGEKCTRCHWREQCLNSGYGVQGDELKQLEANMRGLELPDDGLST